VDRIAIHGDYPNGRLDYIELRHLDIEGTGWRNGYHEDEGGQATQGVTTRGAGHVLINHCYLHDFSFGGQPVQPTQCSDWTFEYSSAQRNASDATAHAEFWQSWGGDRLIVRDSYFEDIEGSAVMYISQSISTGETYARDGIEVYRNVFANYDDGQMVNMGIVGIGGTVVGRFPHFKVYNNTIYGLLGLNSGLSRAGAVGADVRNNRWVECYRDATRAVGNCVFTGDMTRAYNSFYDALYTNVTPVATEEELSAPGLVDPAHRDFRLSAASTPGQELPAPYNRDMFGNTCTAGATDRGALVYVPE